MTFPEKISIPSDNTELELISTEKSTKSKELIGTYKYTKAIRREIISTHLKSK